MKLARIGFMVSSAKRNMSETRGGEAQSSSTNQRETPVGRVAGFQRAPFVGSRRLSKSLDFRPKTAVANFLISGAPIKTGKE